MPNKLSTSAELERLRKEIVEFDPRDWGHSVTKEQLEYELARCYEAYDNLSKNEMLLIWYLRHSSIGTTVKFLAYAKLQYEAYMALPKNRAK